MFATRAIYKWIAGVKIKSSLSHGLPGILSAGTGSMGCRRDESEISLPRRRESLNSQEGLAVCGSEADLPLAVVIPRIQDSSDE